MDEKKRSTSRKRQRVTTTSSGLVLSKRRRIVPGLRFGGTVRATHKQLKSVDIINGPANLLLTSTMDLALMNATSVGSNINNRLGRKIRMRSLRVLGTVQQFQNGTTPVDDFCRIMLIYDRQPNGAVPAQADIFQCIDTAGTTSTGSFTFLNPSNFERFVILRSEAFKMECPSGASATQPAQESTDYKKNMLIDWFVNLRGLETQYNAGTSNNVTDQVSGSLLLVGLGLSASADSQYRFRFNARLRFEDL